MSEARGGLLMDPRVPLAQDSAPAVVVGACPRPKPYRTEALTDWLCSPEQSRNDERFAAMEARIRQLESAFHQPAKNRSSPPGNGVALPAIPDELSSMSMSTPDTASQSGDDGHLTLPPRDQVEYIVQDYFTHLDPALPIFPREACLELVAKWYEAPAERSEVSWAIINTILALSLRGSPSDLMVERLAWAAQCVNNAQSCMNVLAYRNQDLKGLQVVLGLTVLFMESEHPYPACVFLATAVKLVHRLRLMTGVSLPSVHRSHLFWVTYILDRDLCLKTTEPYLIQDHDLDVDIDAHQAGVETSSEDQQTNLLEVRVRLAKIQGKVYDYVYSVRASKLTPDQQEQSVNKLFLMLKAWYESLPPSLKVDHTLQEDADIKKRSMSLHLAFYHALFMAHSTHAFNPEWVAKLSQQDAQSPPIRLPSHWDRLIECSRACISLFNYITSQDLSLQW